MPGVARRRRGDAQPGHAADVQADEPRTQRRRRAGAPRRVERVPERPRVRARAQAGLGHHALEGRHGAARAHPRARGRSPHAARHEGARGGHPGARREARDPPGPRARARGQGRDEARLPPGPGGSPRAAREGVRQRPGVPRLRDGHPDVRRRRLHARLPGRAVLPGREDLQHLRGDEPHPGDGPRRPQARAARGREPAGVFGRPRAVRAEAPRATRRSARR